MASRLGLRSSTARRSKPPRKHNATAQAVEANLGGFCVCMKNGPGTDGRAEAARVRTADRDGMGASRTSRSSCTQILGCLFGAICLGLSGALWSGRLCSIAHGLGQHLAQLGFGLLRCADRSRLDHVMAHKTSYGMLRRELKPLRTISLDCVCRCAGDYDLDQRRAFDRQTLRPYRSARRRRQCRLNCQTPTGGSRAFTCCSIGCSGDPFRSQPVTRFASRFCPRFNAS